MDALMKRILNVMGWLKGKNFLYNTFGGAPVNLNTGNFIHEKEDLNIKGIMPLTFKRFYNGLDYTGKLSLGEGWIHNYEVHIKHVKKKQYIVVLEDGTELTYIKGIGENCVSIMGNKETLQIKEDLFVFDNTQGIKYFFISDGEMIKITEVT